MTIDKIRNFCHAQPFRPFSVHLPDGRQVTVEHPDFAALSPTGRLMVVLHDDDSESIVDMLLVSDITIKASARRNGKKR